MLRGYRLGLLLIAVLAVTTIAGGRGACAQDGDVQPTNNLPDPYQAIHHFGVLTDRQWGAVSAVAMDPDGKSLWVADRCGHKNGPGLPVANDNCAGSNLPPVLEFDSHGKLMRSFGVGLFIYPHSIFVDRNHNVWVADERAATPAELKRFPDAKGKGACVIKFNREGKVLMRLGRCGVPGNPPDHLFQPTSVIVAPDGDIFVSDGHGGPVARIVKYSKDGKFMKTFGKEGSGPGELNTPHSLTMDSKGRLYVADRSNFRVCIFDQQGNFIQAWKQFSRPSGVYIDKKTDTLYVADSESNSIAPHPGWERGIRIGNAETGKVMYFIPDPRKGTVKGTSVAEGVVADAAGNVYGAEVGAEDIAKYIKER